MAGWNQEVEATEEMEEERERPPCWKSGGKSNKKSQAGAHEITQGVITRINYVIIIVG